MKFRKPKELVAEALVRTGVKRPKLLFQPGRGDFFNRIAYRLVKGDYGVVRAEELGEEIRPGKVVEECGELKLLAFRGAVEADAAVVRRPGTVDLSGVKLSYPDFAVDLSLSSELLPQERKSLAVQLEIAYGTVKDFFTPENFFLTGVTPEAQRFLGEFFSPRVPFPVLGSLKGYDTVIVLDPSGEKEFTHEEVTPNTLIVVGGIVDSSKRLEGSTRRIIPEAFHRRITYKGIVELVPDRINEIIKIVCDYLTSDSSLYEAVRRNLTRDSKLHFMRRLVQNSIVRFRYRGELLRGIPYDLYRKWKEELSLTDFYFRKAAKHVGGFFVFRPSIFDKVTGRERVRGKEVFVLKELNDEDVVVRYP